MGKIYGYCRISTNKQSIERQIRNLKSINKDVIIVEEVYTGTKFGRPKWQNLIRNINSGDIIIFDSVSRMSRNAEEGFSMYEELFNIGVELEFIKEPHINTKVYKGVIKNNIAMTNTNIDYLLEGINKYLLALAKEQIKLAFLQSEKEVIDLRQRTKEGIETARLNGKQIGMRKGKKLITKKSLYAKNKIIEHSKDFKGSLKDIDVIKLLDISRNSYYKYKKEITNEGKYI